MHTAQISRRNLIRSAASVSLGMLAASRIQTAAPLLAAEAHTDSMPMQLYKSLTDEQRAKVCLPIDHPRRQFVSNWWYIHPDHRIPGTFDLDQRELIDNIFDSLHNPQYVKDVKKQVRIDQYGQAKNAPAVGFFGTPDDKDFEFIFTGPVSYTHLTLPTIYSV